MLQKKILFCSILFLCVFIYPLKAKNTNNIIPYPNYQISKNGEYKFPSTLKYYTSNEIPSLIIEAWIDSIIPSRTFNFTTQEKDADIVFLVDPEVLPESYKIDVTESNITIASSSEQGLFYALKTLEQLLFVKTNNTISETISIPCLTIKDEPRFSYRGVMLDVSRFFIPKDEILKIIDAMSQLKLNKLHLHLVDDNGWRIEIEKYPRLTEIGAWRVDREEKFPGRSNPKKGEPTPIGGYYTKNDIKEIVSFAADRMIEVIPEIEMPAHTVSSLAAYPQLACPSVDEFIGVLPGIGGPNARFIYCAGNDSVFDFLENVLDEVIEMFPSKYIHLGGDEADKFYWERCSLCKKRMEDEGINAIEELQSYFMNRVTNYVKSKGKQVMGWDELTNSTLPEDVIIFGWQGQGQAALKAAKQGHHFIMTPAQKLYFIRYQGPQWFEPYTYFGNNTLKDVYDYEPIKEYWEPQYKDLLMGIQGSLWTEFCSTSDDVEYLLFPRMLALAEGAWTSPDNKNWESFLVRLDNYTNILENKEVIYAKSMYNISHLVLPKNDSLNVILTSIRPDVEIRYTIDGSDPDCHSSLYIDTLKITYQTRLKANTFQQCESKGKILELDLKFNLATGKKVKSNAHNDYLLTNGLRGSDRHSDFEWVGWHNQDAEIIVDLDEVKSISEVILGSITNYSMAVHKPKQIKISISSDGEKYKPLRTLNNSPKNIFRKVIEKEDIKFRRLNTKGRFVKVEFENPGLCPSDNIRAGMPNWIYFDEIIIK